MNVLVQHIPHAVPVVAIWGIMLRYWLVQRRLERDADGPATDSLAPVDAAETRSRALPVRRSVAVRGLAALGPLLGALATGLVIYALNLGSGRAGAAAIWTHVGLSLLALLLVVYKIADIGLARLRESVRGVRAWRAIGSLVLLTLWIPLLVSGIALLVYPSQASFTAYAHLIASVWWTGLFLWHLRRYLSAATRVVFAGRASAAASAAPSPPARPPGLGQRPDARSAPGPAAPSQPRCAPRERAAAADVPAAGRGSVGRGIEPAGGRAESGATAPGRGR